MRGEVQIPFILALKCFKISQIQNLVFNIIQLKIEGFMLTFDTN